MSEFSEQIKQVHDQNHDICGKEHIRILSINGGGVRGYIPSIVLKYMEELSGERIQDSFDLMCGTSVGGIMSIALAAPNVETGEYLFKGADLPGVCKAASQKVFPLNSFDMLEERFENSKILSATFSKISDLIGTFSRLKEAAYSREGLDKFLDENLGDITLSNVLKPVTAFAFSENERGIKDFSSLRGYDMQYKLKDIAGATSAAPTYLPPKKILDKNCYDACKEEEPGMALFGDGCADKCTITYTDGGTLANNPSMSCYIQLASRCRNKGYKIDSSKVTIVTLGTGKVDFDIHDPKPLTGVITAMVGEGNILDKLMDGNQDMSDKASTEYFKHNYLAFNPYIDKKNAGLDDASDENMANLGHVATKYLENDFVTVALIKLMVGLRLLGEEKPKCDEDSISCKKKLLDWDETMDYGHRAIKEAYNVLDKADGVNYTWSDKEVDKLYKTSKGDTTLFGVDSTTDLHADHVEL